MLFLLPTEKPFVELLAARRLSLQELPVGPLLGALRKAATPLDGQPAPARVAAAELTRQLGLLVGGSEELRAMARDAFVSHVRAYATFSRELKHIFHPRSLHLGQLARSMGLSDPPRVVVRGWVWGAHSVLGWPSRPTHPPTHPHPLQSATAKKKATRRKEEAAAGGKGAAATGGSGGRGRPDAGKKRREAAAVREQRQHQQRKADRRSRALVGGTFGTKRRFNEQGMSEFG